MRRAPVPADAAIAGSPDEAVASATRPCRTTERLHEQAGRTRAGRRDRTIIVSGRAPGVRGRAAPAALRIDAVPRSARTGPPGGGLDQHPVTPLARGRNRAVADAGDVTAVAGLAARLAVEVQCGVRIATLPAVTANRLDDDAGRVVADGRGRARPGRRGEVRPVDTVPAGRRIDANGQAAAAEPFGRTDANPAPVAARVAIVALLDIGILIDVALGRRKRNAARPRAIGPTRVGDAPVDRRVADDRDGLVIAVAAGGEVHLGDDDRRL